MGILHAVRQQQKGRLAPARRLGQQVIQRDIIHTGRPRRNALVAFRAAHAAQLGRVHALDHRARLAGDGRIISRLCGVHGVLYEHGIYGRTAFEQLRHGIFAVHNCGILLCFVFKSIVFLLCPFHPQPPEFSKKPRPSGSRTLRSACGVRAAAQAAGLRLL